MLCWCRWHVKRLCQPCSMFCKGPLRVQKVNSPRLVPVFCLDLHQKKHSEQHFWVSWLKAAPQCRSRQRICRMRAWYFCLQVPAVSSKPLFDESRLQVSLFSLCWVTVVLTVPDSALQNSRRCWVWCARELLLQCSSLPVPLRVCLALRGVY